MTVVVDVLWALGSVGGLSVVAYGGYLSYLHQCSASVDVKEMVARLELQKFGAQQ
jgi:hypothetical protein